MIDDNSLIEELKEIDTTLRNLGEYRKANMISMAIQKIEYCNRVELSNKDKQIEELKEVIDLMAKGC